jgi:hypothetical protein
MEWKNICKKQLMRKVSMETVQVMLESYTNRLRNSNDDLIPVMERWTENCNVRWVMGRYCQLGCVTAEEQVPPQ